MRIALAVDFTSGGMRGGDVYSAELAAALGALDADDEFLLFGYFFSDYPDRVRAFPRPRHGNVRLDIQRWPQSLVRRAEGWGIPVVEWYLRSRGVHLYHAPGAGLPRLVRLASVVTFHDAIPFARPDLVPPESLAAWQGHIRDAAGRATRVLASSTATKDDLVRHLGLDPARVRVAILGVNREVFRKLEDQGLLSAARERYRLPERFVLSVGPYEKRRNWEGLLRAVAALQGGGPLGLVLTGGVPPEAAARLDALAGELKLSGLLRRTGYVPREDLAALYNLAAVFAYPSFYDGFNLPMIEAMACGTPVVVSDRGALPEIAGGAAELVDPERTDSVSDGLRRALAEPGRGRLVAEGLRRAAELSWERTAAATIETYRAALAAS